MQRSPKTSTTWVCTDIQFTRLVPGTCGKRWRSYADELGIRLEVIDASQDIAHEIDELKRAVGSAAARLVHEGDTIILDAGVTTTYMARACGLAGRYGHHEFVACTERTGRRKGNNPGVSGVWCGPRAAPWLGPELKPRSRSCGPTRPLFLAPDSVLTLVSPPRISRRPRSRKL